MTAGMQRSRNCTGNDRSNDHYHNWMLIIVGTIIHWMVMNVQKDRYVFFHEDRHEMTLPFVWKIIANDQWERSLSFR